MFKPLTAPRRLAPALLTAILLVGLALRLASWSVRLEVGLQGDEYKYVLTADGGDETDESTDYRNPSLFRHLLALESRALDWLAPASRAEGREALAQRLALARLTVGLLGAASVGLLYRAGSRLFGRPAGLLGAALLGVNFLHVHQSQFALNDVPAAFFLVAALVPTAELLRGTGAGRAAGAPRLLLAGLLGGLATAAKYNFGIVLLAPLLVCARQARQPAGPGAALRGAGLVGLGALLGLLVGMPETLLAAGEIRAGLSQQMEIGERRWPGQPPGPSLLLYGQALARAFGWPALALSGLGLAWAGWTLVRPAGRPRRRATRASDALLLAVPPAVYLAYMATRELFFARFALPLVPFGCLLAAYGVLELARLGRTAPLRLELALLGGLLALSPPLALSGQLLRLGQATDTRVLAERWLAEQAPPGEKVAAQSYSLPNWARLSQPNEAYSVTIFTPFTAAGQFERLACAGNRYVLISSFRADRQRTVGRPGAPTGYELLAARGRLATTFSPLDGVGQRPPFNPDDVGLPFWELARYDRPGPTIRAYALPPEACASRAAAGRPAERGPARVGARPA